MLAKNTLPKLVRTFGEANRFYGCRLKRGKKVRGVEESPDTGSGWAAFKFVLLPLITNMEPWWFFLSPVIISSDVG